MAREMERKHKASSHQLIQTGRVLCQKQANLTINQKQANTKKKMKSWVMGKCQPIGILRVQALQDHSNWIFLRGSLLNLSSLGPSPLKLCDEVGERLSLCLTSSSLRLDN